MTRLLKVTRCHWDIFAHKTSSNAVPHTWCYEVITWADPGEGRECIYPPAFFSRAGRIFIENFWISHWCTYDVCCCWWPWVTFEGHSSNNFLFKSSVFYIAAELACALFLHRMYYFVARVQPATNELYQFVYRTELMTNGRQLIITCWLVYYVQWPR